MRRLAMLALASLPALVRADEVFVRGGGHVSGEVVQQGPDAIVVDVGSGRITLPASYVERIVPSSTPMDEYRERASLIAEDDAAGWLDLAQWARDHDLPTHARDAFRRVLALDPGRAAAHRGLGHVRVGDEWMTLEESYRARGYVMFEGHWVSPEERRALVNERAAFEESRLRAETEARLREAEVQAREAEAAARRAQEEADAARAEADSRSSWFYGSGWSPWYNSGFYPSGCAGHNHFAAGLGGFYSPFVHGFAVPVRVGAPVAARAYVAATSRHRIHAPVRTHIRRRR